MEVEDIDMSDEKNAQAGVQSIERALDIIEAIAVGEKGRGLTEISNEVGLHKSTAYRIIHTLQTRGYLDKTDEGGYKIGLKMIEAVSCHINSLELQTEARPYVARISSHLGLTSHLGVLDGDKVVYIEKMDVVSSVKLYSQIGLRVYSYCSSLGKCLLSNFSHEELEHIMKDCTFIKFTPYTIDNMDSLYQELLDVRKKGWAMDNEEYEKGHRCIGAPIYDYRGDIIAAISASGERYQLTDERIEEVAGYVRAAAMEISKLMGYTG